MPLRRKIRLKGWVALAVGNRSDVQAAWVAGRKDGLSRDAERLKAQGEGVEPPWYRVAVAQQDDRAVGAVT